MSTWPEDTPGLLRLSSGRGVRGRATKRAPADGLETGPAPEFSLCLAFRRPPERAWSCRWLCWPDFRLPLPRAAADRLLTKAWRRSETERVEIGCRGGRVRTGTALACLAVLEGMSAAAAIDHVRRHYHPRAVEAPWQRRWVERFADRVQR